MRTFRSFDEAWQAFVEGGELVTVEERRADFWQGRAQFLGFAAPLTSGDAVDLALDVQDALDGIEGLVLLPDDYFHITIRPIGFQVIERRNPDEVLRQEVPGISRRATPVMAGIGSLEVTVGPVNVFPDAVILEVHDDSALADVRERLDSVGVADAYDGQLDDPPYLPHVTIAQFHSRDAAGPLRERLPEMRKLPPVRSRIREVGLVRSWMTGVDADEPPELESLRTYRLRR
jgi:2'-5' RNA ligase